MKSRSTSQAGVKSESKDDIIIEDSLTGKRKSVQFQGSVISKEGKENRGSSIHDRKKGVWLMEQDYIEYVEQAEAKREKTRNFTNIY